MSVFQFCLYGLSPEDCTMAFLPLKDNHQYLSIMYCLLVVIASVISHLMQTHLYIDRLLNINLLNF